MEHPHGQHMNQHQDKPHHVLNIEDSKPAQPSKTFKLWKPTCYDRFRRFMLSEDVRAALQLAFGECDAGLPATRDIGMHLQARKVTSIETRSHSRSIHVCCGAGNFIIALFVFITSVTWSLACIGVIVSPFTFLGSAICCVLWFSWH